MFPVKLSIILFNFTHKKGVFTHYLYFELVVVVVEEEEEKEEELLLISRFIERYFSVKKNTYNIIHGNQYFTGS